MTVAIGEEEARWLRKAAGKGKGKLGAKITEAVRLLKGVSEQDEAKERLLEAMRNPKFIGSKRVSRDELHER